MTVAIKGTADGLTVTLGEGNWDEVVSGLSERLAASPAFFAGAEAVLRLDGRRLDAAQLAQVRELFATHGGQLRSVVAEDGPTRAAARGLGLAASAPRAPKPRPATRAESDTASGVVVRRTLRSGQAIRHVGHVVIIGDVNPGAEIVAGGDVVVWGRLRGLVHAGASGDTSAWVCALQLAPTQLRIADRITRPPEATGRPGRWTPEVARVQDDNIVVEAWETS